MKIKRRPAIIVLVAAIALSIIVLVGVNVVKNTISIFNLSQFQSFTVTISNESDYDIVSVETGIINGTSKDTRLEKIKSGNKKKIKPNLSLSGEGAIYMEYTDSRGSTTQKTVCGYTEYLSGNSKVTIHNSKVTVKENCM
ncbi:hypothetical protein [Cohnella sp. WQ 127256]|uniref:hypothetical protein n=1 Tax=Cohnella sp. WQ 127256 TaxID=2938790 RepID=UPI00211741A5|nr:hypothetical protein [Cohnella sp. WQ 127256]